MRELVALSIPTQTAMKGLRGAAKTWLCRSALATFSKSISRVFEITELERRKSRHPGVTAPPL
jgi:hypothetical protein